MSVFKFTTIHLALISACTKVVVRLCQPQSHTVSMAESFGCSSAEQRLMLVVRFSLIDLNAALHAPLIGSSVWRTRALKRLRVHACLCSGHCSHSTGGWGAGSLRLKTQGHAEVRVQLCSGPYSCDRFWSVACTVNYSCLGEMRVLRAVLA